MTSGLSKHFFFLSFFLTWKKGLGPMWIPFVNFRNKVWSPKCYYITLKNNLRLWSNVTWYQHDKFPQNMGDINSLGVWLVHGIYIFCIKFYTRNFVIDIHFKFINWIMYLSNYFLLKIPSIDIYNKTFCFCPSTFRLKFHKSAGVLKISFHIIYFLNLALFVKM